MSRLQTGGLNLTLQDVGLEEIVGSVLAGLGERGQSVRVEVPETLPRVRVDPTLLERAVANVVANALTYAPAAAPVRIEGRSENGRVELRIIDSGPGIPKERRESALLPFQRLDDRSPGGVGLGLPVAAGFVEAMGGELVLSDTPGGGLTVTVSFEAA